jgi:putative Holliday junction resolvase
MPDQLGPDSKSNNCDTADAVGNCIAFDYGSKRIGTAVGNASLQTARPLSVVDNRNGLADWPAIASIIEQWQPTDLVVGWPLDEHGEEQALTPHVRGFVKKLEQRFDRPVHKVDERFSSIAAQEAIRSMRQSGQRKRRSTRSDVDTVAAALILESWFANR